MGHPTIEVGLLEVPTFKDGVYTTFVRVVWSDNPIGLDEASIISDPFMHREVFAKTQVSTWDEAIELIGRLRDKFSVKFACSQGPLWFRISSELHRSELMDEFNQLMRRRRGRPKGSAKRLPEPEVPAVKVEFDF